MRTVLSPTTSRRRILSVIALLALAPLSGCVGFGWEQAKFKQTRTLSVAHSAGKPIDVKTSNGAISVVQGQTSEVTIIANLKATTQERLDATRVVAVRDEHDALSVRVVWPDNAPKGSEGCAFEISLPDAVGVRLQTSNGAITIKGLGGDADLRTSNGQIRADNHAGAVKAESSNGAITITGCSGAVTADSSNGEITLTDTGAPVHADTSNGAVELSMHPAASGPINLSTSNGAIEVTLSPSFLGSLTASTSNGTFSVQGIDKSMVQSLSKKSGVLRFGDATSAAASSLSTSNGSITVRMRQPK